MYPVHSVKFEFASLWIISIDDFAHEFYQLNMSPIAYQAKAMN